MRTRVRQGQTVIGVTLGHRFDYFSWRRGDALTRPLSDGAVPTAERLSGSNASAAPCFCHNQETALCIRVRGIDFWLDGMA